MAKQNSSAEEQTRQARLVADLQSGFRKLVPDSDNADPRLIRFVVERLSKGTKIEVRLEKNHFRPHFHASCSDECNLSVDIQTIEILAGKCKNKIWKEVRSWAYLHRETLLELWNELNPQSRCKFALKA